MLYTNKLSIIVETEYFEGCFSPKHFIVYTCDKDMEVSDNLLYIISKADRIEYKKGCTYIIFNISYVSEIPRLYSLIKNKMTDLNMPEKMEIKDHGILVEVEE